MKLFENKLTTVLAGLVLIISSLSFFGWVFDVPLLKSSSFASAPMKFKATIGFILSSVLILLFNYEYSKNKLLSGNLIKWIVYLFFFVLFYALLDYLDDTLPFLSNLNFFTIDSGRVAPLSILLFLITGAAFVLLLTARDGNSKNSYIAGMIGLIVSAAGMFAFVDFPWFGVPDISGYFDPITLNAALSFILLGGAVFSLSIEALKLEWSLDKKITVGLVIGLILMISMSVVSHSTIHELQQNLIQISRAKEIQYHLSEISSRLLTLEYQKQNYISTGNKLFERNSDSTLKGIEAELNKFRELTKDNPSQQKRASLLHGYILQRAVLLQRTFEAFQTTGSTVITNFLFLKEGTVLINQISSVIVEADKEEKKILIDLEKISRESAKRTFFIVPMGDFASVAIIIWIFMLLNSEVNERLRTEKALRKNENELKRLVDELKLKEEQLSKVNKELTESNKELGHFAYVASHDLQEPLRMVSSFTQLLEKRYKDKLDSDANDFIRFAVDGASRMQRLINDLLEYSRVSTQGKELVTVDLSSVLNMALLNLQTKISETGSVINAVELPCAKGDEIQLMRVFQNLIDNAIKFRGDASPVINIRAAFINNEVVISVKDNGIGIDEKYKERIFVIFQRLHNSAAYPGTGIGLTICKKIIERHNGRIWFESEPGKGTTFYFTLIK